MAVLILILGFILASVLYSCGKDEWSMVVFAVGLIYFVVSIILSLWKAGPSPSSTPGPLD